MTSASVQHIHHACATLECSSTLSGQVQLKGAASRRLCPGHAAGSVSISTRTSPCSACTWQLLCCCIGAVGRRPQARCARCARGRGIQHSLAHHLQVAAERLPGHLHAREPLRWSAALSMLCACRFQHGLARTCRQLAKRPPGHLNGQQRRYLWTCSTFWCMRRSLPLCLNFNTFTLHSYPAP